MLRPQKQRMKTSGLTCALLLSVIAFSRGMAEEHEQYDGPMIEGTELAIIISEAGVVKAKILADKMLQSQKNDWIFPEGIYVEFYKADKSVSATLRANTAYRSAEEDAIELKGDVELKSVNEKAQLNTEELYWNPNAEELHTDKFVRLETENEVITGHGLTANQSLGHYSTSKPQGTLHIESIE